MRVKSLREWNQPRLGAVVLLGVCMLFGWPQISQAQAPAPITITPAPNEPAPAYYGGSYFGANFTASGGIPTLQPNPPFPPIQIYNWSVSGSLPPGTQFNSIYNNASVSGVPTALGTFNFTVEATDSVGTKGSQAFAITVGYLFTITSLSPPSALRDSGGFVLVVNGNGFFDPSQATTTVRWNGTPLPTVFVSPARLQASVASNFLTQAGTVNIDALAESDGISGLSNVVTFSVTNPLPTLTSLSPDTLPAGTGAFTLTANGTNFLPGATLYWNGAARTTTFVNSGQVTASISANDIQSSGTAQVSVANPDGGISNTLTFRIGPPLLTFSYTLSGQPIVPVNPGGTVPFPATPIGSSQSAQFQVSNAGSAALTIGAISVTNAAFSLANLPALPAILAPSSSLTFTIAFAPASVGSVSGTLSISGQTFLLSGTGNQPQAPDVSITGLTDTIPPAEQATFGVALTAPYPFDIAGTATLTFAPDAVNPSDDPNIVFVANGLRVLDFTIPANSTEAVFTGQTAFQTGTVAGAITLTVNLQSGGIDVTPLGSSRTIIVSRGVPVISSVTITQNTSGFQVQAIGFSTPREVTGAAFNFTAKSGTLQTASFSVPVGPPFTSYYQSQASTQFGSQFQLTVPFTVQGSASIASVSVTLTNSVGTSAATSANF